MRKHTRLISCMLFYFFRRIMDYRRRKTSKCRNFDCICWNCTNKRNTSLTKCPNGNCRYCESEHPNNTQKCENFNDKRLKDK